MCIRDRIQIPAEYLRSDMPLRKTKLPAFFFGCPILVGSEHGQYPARDVHCIAGEGKYRADVLTGDTTFAGSRIVVLIERGKRIDFIRWDPTATLQALDNGYGQAGSPVMIPRGFLKLRSPIAIRKHPLFFGRFYKQEVSRLCPGKGEVCLPYDDPVSYTHLTLPTILRV